MKQGGCLYVVLIHLSKHSPNGEAIELTATGQQSPKAGYGLALTRQRHAETQWLNGIRPALEAKERRQDNLLALEQTPDVISKCPWDMLEAFWT